MKEDNYNYQGWLNSDNFLKRAFAITGYHFVAGLLIYLAMFLIALLFGVIL